jgi:hypothetical protein
MVRVGYADELEGFAPGHRATNPRSADYGSVFLQLPAGGPRML